MGKRTVMVKMKGKVVVSLLETFTKSWSDGSWLNGICNMFENLFGRLPDDPQKVARVVFTGPISWIDPGAREKASTVSEAEQAKHP